jgi:hypothetical protein
VNVHLNPREVRPTIHLHVGTQSNLVFDFS